MSCLLNQLKEGAAFFIYQGELYIQTGFFVELKPYANVFDFQ